MQRTYPHQYRFNFRNFLIRQHFYSLISDFASVMTVIGNALRFPAHFFSNGEVREQLIAIFNNSDKVFILFIFGRLVLF